MSNNLFAFAFKCICGNNLQDGFFAEGFDNDQNDELVIDGGYLFVRCDECQRIYHVHKPLIVNYIGDTEEDQEDYRLNVINYSNNRYENQDEVNVEFSCECGKRLKGSFFDEKKTPLEDLDDDGHDEIYCDCGRLYIVPRPLEPKKIETY